MPIKVEIIGDAPGQAGLKIVGLGGGDPGAGHMRLTRINSKTSLGADRQWHAEEQWLTLPELIGEGTALLGRVGADVVDPLALLGPSDIVGMTVRLDGRSEEGRVKTDKLYGSHLQGATAQPIPEPEPQPEPVPEPQPEPEPEPKHEPIIVTPRPPIPSQQSPLPIIAAIIAALLVIAGGAAYFLLFADKTDSAAVASVEQVQEPAAAAAPDEINTREDLAKFIAATPQPDKAQAMANTLVRRGKLDLAMLLFQHAARGGNTEAALALAHMYDPDTWTAQTSAMAQADAETAAYWYEPAAQAGNVEAQRQLGKIMVHLMPSGFQHDKGLEWLKKAADAGDAQAKDLLAKLK